MSSGISFNRYSVFDWVIYHKVIPINNTYVVSLTADTDWTGLGNITLVTKGLITGVNRATNAPVVNRAPGYTNKDRTNLLAGVYDFTAQQDSEWWCISKQLNGNRLPQIEIFSASAGQTVQKPVGTKLFLCEGSLSIGGTVYNSPQAFNINSQQTELVVNTQSYGFIFTNDGA